MGNSASTCVLPDSNVNARALDLKDVCRSPVVYKNDLEAIPLGQANDRTIKKFWNTRYAKGPDEGRVHIVGKENGARRNRGLRVKYPAKGNQSSRSGATWETNLGGDFDELYLAYWVKFGEDFEWVKGGKLPGLGGMPSPFPRNSRQKFRIRLMWREEGKLEFYLHDYSLKNKDGEEPYRNFWDLGGEHRAFEKGKWHHLEMHVKLNTPGKLDGVLEGWFDGELAFRDTDSNVGVRGRGEHTRLMNYFYFSSFFGGSSAPASQWQPSKDVYIYYDDFVVSGARIGMNPLSHSEKP